MIRFKCIYCGQRILACDDGVGKKGKCPKCEHMLVVPKTTKGRPAISSDKEPMPDRPKPYVPEWAKDMHQMTPEREEALIELFKESFGFLIPTYDKLSLFLMTVTLILLYVGNSQVRDWMRDLTQAGHSESIVFLTVFNFFFILCIILFFQILVPSEETDFKKKIMLFFAVLINAITGIIAGTYVVRNATASNWLLVFPIWNIINCVLLLLMLYFRIIDEDCISDRKATFVQTIIGLTAVLFVFILCNYVLKLHWAITYSICIVYTTSFDKALQNVFPGLMYRGDE